MRQFWPSCVFKCGLFITESCSCKQYMPSDFIFNLKKKSCFESILHILFHTSDMFVSGCVMVLFAKQNCW